MGCIRVNTEQTREAGRRLLAEGDRLAEIGYDLQRAISSLDTWAWDGASRWRAESLLAQVRPQSAQVASGLDDLGRKLLRVADVFETEDATAAQNVVGMPWVDWSGGGVGSGGGSAGGGGGSAGSRGGSAGGRGVEVDGSAGYSWSLDQNGDVEREREVEVNVPLVNGALYDGKDATGDVRMAGRDVGDYHADVKAGTYEGGARVGFGEDGLTAGVYGEVGTVEATAGGVIGGSALGVAAAGTLAGPKAEGFIGIKDNTFGASIGGSLASAEAEVGLNIAGANVGVTGGVSLGFEFGFKIGEDTEVKFGPFKVGLSFGTAKK